MDNSPPSKEHGNFATGGTISPELALASLIDHDGPLVIDFDETLYLRNSTEDFIGTAAPGLFGFVLLKSLDLIQPWRLTGGKKTRDAWRVRFAAMFPFAMRRWHTRAAELAATETNEPIRDALRARSDAVIATLGFEPIVRPLLNAMELGDRQLIACEMGSFGDRRAGKLALVSKALGDRQVSRAALLTDSHDDEDMLAQCKLPLFVKWPEARFVPAHSGLYIPLEYTHRIKRPGLSFVQRSILGDDWMLWLLATITIAASPATHIVGLFLLVLSFWTIYELGYVDNDKIGALYETAPALTKEFHKVPVATSVSQGWIWAIGLGLAGIAVIEQTLTPSLVTIAAWKAVLIGTFGVYFVYNRTDKDTRVWFYALLQMARAGAVLAVVPVSLLGSIAIAAHAISRWIVYYVYRSTKGSWPVEMPANILRLMIFGLAAIPLFAAIGVEDLDRTTMWTAAILLVWFTFRSGPRLLAIFSKARWILPKTEVASKQ